MRPTFTARKGLGSRASWIRTAGTGFPTVRGTRPKANTAASPNVGCRPATSIAAMVTTDIRPRTFLRAASPCARADQIRVESETTDRENGVRVGFLPTSRDHDSAAPRCADLLVPLRGYSGGQTAGGRPFLEKDVAEFLGLPGDFFPKLAQLREGRFPKLLAWTPSSNSNRTFARDGSTSIA